jgi:hypothetical protein
MDYDNIITNSDSTHLATFHKSTGDINLYYKNWTTELKDEVEYYSAWMINHEAIHGVINDIHYFPYDISIAEEYPMQCGIDIFGGKALMDLPHNVELCEEFKTLHSIAFYRSWRGGGVEHER